MKRSKLISTMFLSLLLLVGVSCSTDRATAPSEPAASPDFGLLDNGGLLGTGLLKGLMTCSPLPPATVSKSIGTQGGVITVGPHSLVIPPGALSSTVTITAKIVSENVNSVHFDPQGLKFASNHPAVLTMSYANCSLLAQLAPKKIVYTTDALNILSVLLSLDNILSKKVSAPIEHFSRYAVAY